SKRCEAARPSTGQYDQSGRRTQPPRTSASPPTPTQSIGGTNAAVRSSASPPSSRAALRRFDTMSSLTPAQIVAELDRYIVGQTRAKRAVAIALRNRWRRQNVPPELRDEVAPKNIIMIGPTGVGKTEIARRLAKLAQAPFVKVEASKYTEVGYVGRDV